MINPPSSHIIRFVAVCSLSICVASVAQAPVNNPPNPNVEVLQLGPQPQGFANVALTPDYRHAAITGPSGSRMTAFLDGQAADKYDQVSTVPPVISADGKHWAFSASKGGQYYMIVDGKEFGPYLNSFPPYRGGNSSNNTPVTYNMTPRSPIVFSPDGKHSAFIAVNGTQSLVVEDGKQIAQPGMQVDTVAGLVFSSQGDHLAFVLRNNSNSAHVVVDGVAGPNYYSVLMPQFSDDGQHLEYVARKDPGTVVVVVDGKEGPVFNYIGNNSGGNILLGSDGSHVAYAASSNGPAGSAKSGAVIDARFLQGVTQFWISPNSKFVAYINRPATGQSRIEVVINDKVGLDYAAFHDLHFAPDGHPIYTVQAATGKTFLVDNEVEYGPYDSADLNTLHFSSDGKHWAYVASADGRQFVVLDGKNLTEFGAITKFPAPNSQLQYERMMYFSIDDHIVYHASAPGSGINSLVKDGQVLGQDGMISPDDHRVAIVKGVNPGGSAATATVTLDGQTGPAFTSITKMAFSPDSKHFAYVGSRPVQNGTGKDGGFFLFVDGVQKGEYGEIAELQFSPDSQHLFHFVTSHINGGPGSAYMDQKLFYTIYWLPGYFNTWLDDHKTLQILGLGGNFDKTFYRIRYFLPGADRKQGGAAATGTGQLNTDESQRLIGGGGPVIASPAAE